VVATFSTDSVGNFAVVLPAGAYTVVPAAGSKNVTPDVLATYAKFQRDWVATPLFVIRVSEDKTLPAYSANTYANLGTDSAGNLVSAVANFSDSTGPLSVLVNGEDAVLPLAPDGGKEVYWVGGAGGDFYSYSGPDAAASACRSLNGVLASRSQLEGTVGGGGSWCATGWVTDGKDGLPGWPSSAESSQNGATKCGGVKDGMTWWTANPPIGGATCYGVKPAAVPSGLTIFPWNQNDSGSAWRPAGGPTGAAYSRFVYVHV
jgi:hypothetical protein